MKKGKTGRVFLRTVGTTFGSVSVVWSFHRGVPKILRVCLPGPGKPAARAVKKFFPDAVASTCREIDAVAERISASMRGEQVRFSLDSVRLDLCSPFQRKVLRALYAVPRGTVTTYGRLAACVGKPGAARAVGRAMATNPFPIIVPCHLVIRSDGSLGGFQPGPKMKRALLRGHS